MTALFDLAYNGIEGKPDPKNWQQDFIHAYETEVRSTSSWRQSHTTLDHETLSVRLGSLYKSQVATLKGSDYYAAHAEFKDLLERYKATCKKYGHDYKILFRDVNDNILAKNNAIIDAVKDAGKIEDKYVKLYKTLSNKSIASKKKKQEIKAELNKIFFDGTKKFNEKDAALITSALLNDKAIAGNDYNLMICFYSIWKKQHEKYKGNSYSEHLTWFKSRPKLSASELKELKKFVAQDEENTRKFVAYLNSLITAKESKTDVVLLKLAICTMLAFITIEPAMMVFETIFEVKDHMNDTETYAYFFANLGCAFVLAAVIIYGTLSLYNSYFEKVCLKNELKKETAKYDSPIQEHHAYTLTKIVLGVLALIEAFAFLLLVGSASENFHDQELMSIGYEASIPLLMTTFLLAGICLLSVYANDILPIQNIAEKKKIEEDRGEKLLEPVRLESKRSELVV